jgi:hypothetical protein
MPFKRAARIRLLKGDIDRAGGETQTISPRALVEVDGPFLKMGIAVTSGPNANAAYHALSPATF